MALYRVKLNGGRRWSAFDAELRAENERRLNLEAELRRAIPAGEIEPWFQPVVDARDGRVPYSNMLGSGALPCGGQRE